MAPSSLKRKRHRMITAPTPQQDQKNQNSIQEQPLVSPSFLNNTLLRRLGLGLLGAVYTCTVLTALLVVAIVLGFGIVTMWAEEPVFVKEKVYFDYTLVRPEAVMRFPKSVPVGHGFHLRLALLLPDSGYNRDIGVFQVVADLISENENVVARTSQPCMLKFRSLPIRLMRTFLLGVPLVIGLSSETQKIIIPILNHREQGYPRTKIIKVSLIPRPGTNFIPHIYESEIILNSKLPWKKEIVRRWKWTFCIWTSLYVYSLLLAVLLCCFRWVIFPCVVDVEQDEEKIKKEEVAEDRDIEKKEDSEVSEMLKRWRRRRSKRKEMISDGGFSDTMEPLSASSMSVTREDTCLDSEEMGVRDSAPV